MLYSTNSMVFEQKTGRVSGLCESPIGNREINVVRSFFGKTCAVHNVYYNWKYWDIKGKSRSNHKGALHFNDISISFSC